MFKALMLSQQDQQTIAEICPLQESDLPQGEVLVEVAFSSLNYKDGLAITGKGPIVRSWPMVPGIDLVGRVLESASADIAVGSTVICTGWGMGEQFWGGMSQRARLKAEWLLPLPASLTGKQSMQLGTAGLTAMLCVMGLEEAGVTPERGDIVVTGASGGVGSVAVALLARLGYRVVAMSGRQENREYLLSIGASEVLLRDEYGAAPARALDKQRWAGAIDTVGSHYLARLLSQTAYGGAVMACGLAAGADLPASVMPFILRNVRLQGIDSVMAPLATRQLAWQRLGELLPAEFYQQACREVTLEQVVSQADALMAGQVTGRIVVRLQE